MRGGPSWAARKAVGLSGVNSFQVGSVVEIRLATLHDVDLLLPIQQEVQRLHASAHPDLFRRSTDEELRAEMERFIGEEHLHVWVATRGGALLGFAVAQVEDVPGNPFRLPMRVMHIDQIVVLRQYRRQGIGHALLDTIRSFAQQAHCSAMQLDVLEFNQSAKAFYVREGFEPFRQRMVMRLPQT